MIRRGDTIYHLRLAISQPTEIDAPGYQNQGDAFRYSQIAPVATHQVREVEPPALESHARVPGGNGPDTDNAEKWRE